tara:strand:+ start:52 stop:1260 length:1209 start_codon:yes stop_codon:yes gene_type:complete
VGFLGKNKNVIANNLSNVVSDNSTQLLTGRVLSVDQTSNLSNGNIIVEVMGARADLPERVQILATPFFPNIKQPPLKNEVVFLILAPNGDYSSNSSKVSYYYFTPLNIWGNVNTNPTPNPYENIKSPTQNKSAEEVEAGSPNLSSESDTSPFKPGTYFEEKSNIYPLYPFEGDIIYEGRFGNSIRFGSTDIIQSQPANNWSITGSNGDPITIFRNGQNPELPSPAQSTTVEEINKDLSSIYLTSTQKVPINVSSQNKYFSYDGTPPIQPNQYSGAQVIINSGRLVFNTTQDHLMLSSQKTINLNSQDGINFDTVGPVVLEAPSIQLGSSTATESVLLGDSTVDLLQQLISDLSSLLGIMSTQIGNNGILLEPTATTARTIRSNLSTYQSQLDSLKSNIVKVE